MPRRGLAVALLAILAVQFLGAMAFTSVCVEPCPDDTEETSCPPVCALCTSCTHGQQAIVQLASDGAPLTTTHQVVPKPLLSIVSQPAADIFHVPLLG